MLIAREILAYYAAAFALPCWDEDFHIFRIMKSRVCSLEQLNARGILNGDLAPRGESSGKDLRGVTAPQQPYLGPQDHHTQVARRLIDEQGIFHGYYA